MNAIKYTISQLYFGKELYKIRKHLLSIIRSLNTVFTAIGICHTGYIGCLLARSWPRQQTVNITALDIPNLYPTEWSADSLKLG